MALRSIASTRATVAPGGPQGRGRRVMGSRLRGSDEKGGSDENAGKCGGPGKTKRGISVFMRLEPLLFRLPPNQAFSFRHWRMPYIFAFGHKDNVFGQVAGVVADAFQCP